MADHIIRRQIRGGMAHFRAGAALSELKVSTNVEFGSGVFMTVDTNTVRITWRDAEAGPMLSMIESILDATRGTVRHIASANECWIDFEEPEYAHITSEQLSTLNEVEAVLVYNVHLKVPSSIADLVSDALDQAVAGLTEVHSLWDRSQSNMSVLRLFGTNIKDIIKVKERAQAILTGQIINFEPKEGSLVRHEV
ncbi:hypothetical protein OPT61_g8562 [Boeremia exigua]|uniref:Uncharacterized protein n=1 Tax=Boeremia exigua TaxID=749465 RepID=A0ACC2HZE3_9PLEO|nr:hypothetical protein OPT61_g8562 [Boeremia exigua]